MMQKIEYIIKHNDAIQKIYKTVFTWIFKIIGVFIKRENKILFQSMIGKTFGDSPRILYEKIINDNSFDSYEYVWAFDNPEAFSIPKGKKVKLNSLGYFIESLKSRIWITNVDIERGLGYKPKDILYINTWHGVPIKYIGNAQFNRNDYDYSDVTFMCTCCDFQSEVFVRDFNVKTESLISCGMPRNDVLYNVTNEDKETIRKRLGLPVSKKIILYAPTWRDSKDGGANYTIKPPINIEKWEQKLGEEYIVLFRMHHLTTEQMEITFDDFAKDFSGDYDINDLMIVADILITDYSSTIFDYSILEKPIISFAYDYDEYKRTRGVYLDLDDIIPGNVFFDENSMLNSILNMDYVQECEKSKRIKSQFMQTDGNATATCMKIIKERHYRWKEDKGAITYEKSYHLRDI